MYHAFDLLERINKVLCPKLSTPDTPLTKVLIRKAKFTNIPVIKTKLDGLLFT